MSGTVRRSRAGKGRPTRWGPRRAARWCAALLARWMPELAVFGCSLWGVGAPWPWPESRHGSALAERPPPGHPERLCPHIPPTEVERELWSRLDLSA